MFAMKKRNLAATFALTAAGVTAAGLAIATPAAQASTARANAVSASRCQPSQFSFECGSPGPQNFRHGEHLWALHKNSPLRDCASTSCRVIAHMPATRNLRPGGGWVTSKANQNANAAWCVINYRGTTDWTGCWRLSA